MCGILAFLPVSCSDDSPVTGSPLLPEAPEGKVNVFLSLHKGSDYESPATRSGTAADETIMGPPWVLVFLGNDKDATFLEAVQANMTSAGELYAQLSACNSSVVLLLISNADELIQGSWEVLRLRQLYPMQLPIFFCMAIRRILLWRVILH